MSREWKPGDVAMVTIGGIESLAFRDRLGWVTTARDKHADNLQTCEGADCPARPLVVIDAEDREQVERLIKALSTGQPLIGLDPMNQDLVDAAWVRHTQAALREFANPTQPKPEEPTDPAVRVFASGTAWARVGSWWITPAMDEVPRLWDWLVERDDFRVLSEGVVTS